MNKYLIILIGVLLSSCATILNKSTQRVTIQTSKPSEVKFRGFDLDVNHDSTKFTFNPMRSDIPIKLDVKTDSIKKSIELNSRLDPILLLNLYNYGIGYIIDLNSQKRFKYPRKNYIDFDEDPNGVYYPYMPLSQNYVNRKNRIKITPFRLFQGNGPALEMSYERVFKNKLALQLNAGVIQNFLLQQGKQHHGSMLSIEGRYYFGKNRYYIQPYISIETGYVQDFYEGEGRFTHGVTRDTVEKLNFNLLHQEVYLAPKIGVQAILSERVSLETYIGLGVRERSMTHHNVPENYERLTYGYYPSPPRIGNNENARKGTFTEAKFLFNFRLGILF